MFKEYLLQNWALILILLAFAISLATTVFLEKRSIIRLYVLIVSIFILSIIVYIEFSTDNVALRNVLMAIRYSATPFIIALITHALVKKMRWFIYLPASALLILDIVSIFTGIVSSIDENNEMVRGPLWVTPYVFVGIYSVLLIFLLVRRSNKRLIEMIPIGFMAFALGSGLVLPFIFKADYAKVFSVSIAIALFAYYEFSVLQLTKKDSLTGLLNRHAYFADISRDPKSISALVSIDMNGLKAINDTEGHDAGDEALSALSLCFRRALKGKESGYRVGGDEFIIVCRRTKEEEVLALVERIKKNVSETKYSCAIGYGLNLDGNKDIDQLLRESDAMMYSDKDKYYEETGINRRHI